ncbi:ESX-1 secretion system protein eccCa1 [Mycobacterium tuberculosis]|nr:ESX-1 secretion system protein eccCa1 [Mycobacterium tuberculosis]
MTTKKFTPTITRGPRLTPGEISLTPPDDLGIDIPPSGVQKILPYVMGGAMLGMIAIMVAGGTRQLSPYMLMMPLMMIVMMVGGLAGSTGGGGKKVPEINADRKEYLRYLAGLRTRVTSSATSQVAFFSYHAPHPEDLLSIVGTQRQWSRPANADFYAATRIGIGDQAGGGSIIEAGRRRGVGRRQRSTSAVPGAGQSYVGGQVSTNPWIDP